MQQTLLHLGLEVFQGFQWELKFEPKKDEEKCPGDDAIQALCNKDKLAKYSITDKDKLTKTEAKAFVRDIVEPVKGDFNMDDFDHKFREVLSDLMSPLAEHVPTDKMFKFV